MLRGNVAPSTLASVIRASVETLLAYLDFAHEVMGCIIGANALEI